ncbi:MAG: hypothetical protein C5B56_00295 [Proteobacteria bacterium]|jgi:acyl-CoA reductase-like NAD-dependent aldehyde dehydrogenase|nr:MAG: hypothetical protein C5B56_00295 [Pseudomonadota bacterium]
MFVGDWSKSERAETLPVLNPALDEVIDEVPKASKGDLDRATISLVGMVSINHHGIALTETPLDGIKDSGSDWEGGREGIREYQNLKFVSQATA